MTVDKPPVGQKGLVVADFHPWKGLPCQVVGHGHRDEIVVCLAQNARGYQKGETMHIPLAGLAPEAGQQADPPAAEER